MADPKRSPVTPPKKQFEVRWGDGKNVDQIYVDELLCQLVDQRAYVTFGQARFPLETPDAPSETSVVEIRPVVRLILNKEKLERITELFTTLLKKHGSEKK